MAPRRAIVTGVADAGNPRRLEIRSERTTRHLRKGQTTAKHLRKQKRLTMGSKIHPMLSYARFDFL
jgi:hypothetical protein